MKEVKFIPPKIYKTTLSEELDESSINRLKGLSANWVVYHYNNYGYDGDGFIVWRNGNKYGYTRISHCSCYGPVDDLNSIMYSKTEIDKIAKNDGENGIAVMGYIKLKKL